MKKLRCYDQCFQSLYNSFQQISARNSIKTRMVLPLDLYFSLSSLSVCLWIYRTMMGKVLFPKQRMFSSSKEELLKLCGSWGFFEITDLSLDFFFFGRFRETVGICLEFKRVSKMAQGGKSEIINQALQMFVGKEPFDYMQWIVHLNAGEMGTAWISRPWAAILGGKELVGDGKTGVCILSALLPIAIFMDLTLCLSDSALSTASPGKIAQNKPSASAFSLCIELSLPSHGHIPFLIWDSMSLSQSSLFLWCLLLVSPSFCFCGLSVFLCGWVLRPAGLLEVRCLGVRQYTELVLVVWDRPRWWLRSSWISSRRWWWTIAPWMLALCK